MGVVFNLIGVAVLAFMLASFAWAARNCALGALSLPCVMLLTSFIYFYLMPLLFLLTDGTHFFGLAFDDLTSVHMATGLYVFGAMCAFIAWRRPICNDPRIPAEREAVINPKILWIVLGLAVLGVFAKLALGLLSLAPDASEVAEQANNVNFLQLSDSLLISVSVIFLIRTNFRLPAMILIAFTAAVFLMDGFRFRLVILASSVIISFALTKRINIRTSYVIIGSIVAIGLLNAIGISRRYGAGLDLTQLQDLEFSNLFQSFGAEVGPVFVLMHLTQSSSTPTIGFDPWYIAITRLIPTFIWPDKPMPLYLSYYAMGFPDPNAAQAGIAGTQQAEFFLQFGWVGLPILAFLFFSVAAVILHRMRFLSFEGRIAGAAIVPSLFGFYAQQRGYAFQQLCEILFTLAPLFLSHLGTVPVQRDIVPSGSKLLSARQKVIQ